MSIQLELRDVSVALGDRTIVRDIDFSLQTGSIACLLGPSGCGKTTLLRAIAGFEPIASGEIRLHGSTVSRPGETLPPERRHIGMLFQDFALFPHLSVAGNLGFGLRDRSGPARRARIDELLELIGLRDAQHRYPHELSGGMQQRVALARAIAPRPQALLLDEPFSSLDPERREQLAREVREMLKRERMTAVLVTHDQLEAFAMADEIGVMSEGRIRQWGSGFDLYHEPADRFVADFIGQGARLPATVIDPRRVATELGEIQGAKPHGLAPGQAAELLIRPDDLMHDPTSPIRAVILERDFRGAAFLYRLRLPSGAEVLSLAPSHEDHNIGDRIGIRPAMSHLVLFAGA
ncbi:ABC transporter ATP-binding protein [Thiocystis violacea]|uniref:ABC transporter ATP-binding protein n=1 Tax=Thiocystis violacea TaxID=13725 RepID=UPI001905E3A3|nr:ABC transporter ATP-binding protein [Thiocystis violacea]MBK1717704.1 ABC transporter ATP-binding protein [Thiocystis violacea]